MIRHKSTAVSLHCLFKVVILICAAASVCLPSQPQARDSSSINREHPVLQAIMVDKTSYSSHRYLYLRVFEDGTVEYHNILDVDLTRPIPVVAKQLRQEDIEGLIALLRLPFIQKLSGTFERDDMGVVRETLNVEIYRGAEVQKVSLVNFHSDRNVPGRRPYPEAAVRLGCMVDRLEQNAKSSDWQSKECENLPKVN